MTVDTNVLLRAVVEDDWHQAAIAERLMQKATVLAISTAGLCEFVWVLDRRYKFTRAELLDVLETLLAIPSVRVDNAAIHAGLTLLKAGGDFSDGVLAHEGRRLSGEVFASFDRRAVSLLETQGQAVQQLGP